MEYNQLITSDSKLTDTYTTTITFQGRRANRIDSDDEKLIKQQFYKAFREHMLSNSSRILTFEGCNSLFERIDATILNKLIPQKVNGKNFKLTAKNKNYKAVKFNSTSRVSAPKKPSKPFRLEGKQLSSKTPSRIKLKLVKQPTASVLNIQSLIAAFNSKLPKTVQHNMGSPRLNNITGRFAESAEVTDITQTQKGFPSIEYTYMTNHIRYLKKMLKETHVS
jgi:hypothetical protein